MVHKLQLKDAIFVDGMRITFDRINEAFIHHHLKSSEMAVLFKRYPHFHRWFINKHRQVFS